jgi:hypothetical protein
MALSALFSATQPANIVYFLRQNLSEHRSNMTLAFVKEYRRRPSKVFPGQGLTPLFPAEDDIG